MFDHLLEMAQRGAVDEAIALMDARADLLAKAGAPGPADVATIREVLRLDRELSAAIRARMVRIRDEAREGHHGRQALQGYGRQATLSPRRALDRTG
jgi:hypothetical protein